MVDETIKKELLAVLDQMPALLQAKVLAYADGLRTQTPPGTPGAQLLKHAGSISAESAVRMRQVIDQEFGQVKQDD